MNLGPWRRHDGAFTVKIHEQKYTSTFIFRYFIGKCNRVINCLSTKVDHSK